MYQSKQLAREFGMYAIGIFILLIICYDQLMGFIPTSEYKNWILLCFGIVYVEILMFILNSFFRRIKQEEHQKLWVKNDIAK